MLVDTGGDTGGGTGRHQLDKDDHTGAGGVPIGVPCGGLNMEDGGADYQRG